MITITLGYWMIPTIITIISLVWALFIVDGGQGRMSFLSNIIALVPALGISCLAWIVYSILK
jgi:hypothetical protein